MPDDTRTGSSDPPSSPEIVELKRAKDGVYEPVSATCDEAPRPRRARILKPKAKSDLKVLEEDVVTGFREGVGLVRRVAKAFDVDL